MIQSYSDHLQGVICSLFMLLILKFVKNIKVNEVNAFCVKMCAVRTAVRHTSSHRTHWPHWRLHF